MVESYWGDNGFFLVSGRDASFIHCIFSLVLPLNKNELMRFFLPWSDFYAPKKKILSFRCLLNSSKMLWAFKTDKLKSLRSTTGYVKNVHWDFVICITFFITFNNILIFLYFSRFYLYQGSIIKNLKYKATFSRLIISKDF